MSRKWAARRARCLTMLADRTAARLLPKQPRYQAALCPGAASESHGRPVEVNARASPLRLRLPFARRKAHHRAFEWRPHVLKRPAGVEIAGTVPDHGVDERRPH